jgi:hypothetical protein
VFQLSSFSSIYPSTSRGERRVMPSSDRVF